MVYVFESISTKRGEYPRSKKKAISSAKGLVRNKSKVHAYSINASVSS